jgi:hypothetical protein
MDQFNLFLPQQNQQQQQQQQIGPPEIIASTQSQGSSTQPENAEAEGSGSATGAGTAAAAATTTGAHPSGIVPTLQNIVATVNLDCKLDLKTIALHSRNAEYNPKVSSFAYSLSKTYYSFY